MNKTMFYLWLIAATANLLAFATGGSFDKLMIAALEGLLAWDRYDDWKKEGV